MNGYLIYCIKNEIFKQLNIYVIPSEWRNFLEHKFKNIKKKGNYCYIWFIKEEEEEGNKRKKKERKRKFK